MKYKVISSNDYSFNSIKKPYHFPQTHLELGFLALYLILHPQPLIHPDFGILDISPVLGFIHLELSQTGP